MGLARLSPLTLAEAVVVAFLPWLLNALRVWNWLRWEGARRPYGDCLRVIAACELGAAVTPTSVGSASVKTMMLSRRGLSLERALAITAAGSVEDGLFFVLAMPPLLVASGVWRDGLLERLLAARPVVTLAVAAAAAVAAVFVVRRSARGRRVLGSLLDAWRHTRRLIGTSLRERPLAWAGNLLLSALQWLARYSLLVALLGAFGLDAQPLRVLVLQWLCSTLMALVPTPGAAGGAELLFLGLFAAEIPGPLLLLLMSAWRLLGYYLPTLVAVGLLALPRGEPCLEPLLDASRD